MDWRRCFTSGSPLPPLLLLPLLPLLLLLLLLCPGPSAASVGGLPVLVPPFIDYWELYPDGYVNDLLTKLTPVRTAPSRPNSHR